jgi:Arc/MetJ-type ribon-helix-helix transcriptional regulator
MSEDEPLSEIVTFRVTKQQKQRVEALRKSVRGVRLSQADIVRASVENALSQPDFIQQTLNQQNKKQ